MLDLDGGAVADLGQRHNVVRLSLFGSGSTDDFDPEHSDADFLVEFSPESRSPFDEYFGMKEGLEALLARPVDLVTARSLENPHFTRSAEATRVEIYAS